MNDLLLNEIEVDIENCNYRYVKIYEEVVHGLKKIFPDNLIKNIVDKFNELKYDFEMNNTYEAIKAETLRSTGDEYLAKDIAWELVYGG